MKVDEERMIELLSLEREKVFESGQSTVRFRTLIISPILNIYKLSVMAQYLYCNLRIKRY